MATICGRGPVPSHAVTVECHYAPDGDSGLEGFQLGQRYPAEWVDHDVAPGWWRIWPDAERSPNYYERCSKKRFGHFFRVIKRTSP